jgi:hypothetical protein
MGASCCPVTHALLLSGSSPTSAQSREKDRRQRYGARCRHLMWRAAASGVHTGCNITPARPPRGRAICRPAQSLRAFACWPRSSRSHGRQQLRPWALHMRVHGVAGRGPRTGYRHAATGTACMGCSPTQSMSAARRLAAATGRKAEGHACAMGEQALAAGWLAHVTSARAEGRLVQCCEVADAPKNGAGC